MRLIIWSSAIALVFLARIEHFFPASGDFASLAFAVTPTKNGGNKKDSAPIPHNPQASQKPAHTIPADQTQARHDNDTGALSSHMPFKIDIPIAWEMTRARLMGAGIPLSTLTESFRETWTLELRPTGTSFLTSPRARVRVYVAGVKYPAIPAGLAVAEFDTDRAVSPISVEAIGVSEREFAHLIGLPSFSDSDGETEGEVMDEVGSGKLVTLSLLQRASTDVTLRLSNDEHFAVHIELANTAVVF